jgi:hypothetical protein
VHNRDAARWWVVRTRLCLTFACVAFFMVVLDTTVVNFALPAIDHGADRSRRSWTAPANAATGSTCESATAPMRAPLRPIRTSISFSDVTWGRGVRDQFPRHVVVHQVGSALLERGGDRERPVGGLVRGLFHVRLLLGNQRATPSSARRRRTDPMQLRAPRPHEHGAALELH